MNSWQSKRTKGFKAVLEVIAVTYFPKLKAELLLFVAPNLWCYKQQLQKRLARELGGFNDQIHLIDGFPIPLCH